MGLKIDTAYLLGTKYIVNLGLEVWFKILS